MQRHQFHAKFANTPLSERSKILNFNKYHDLTLNLIYERIKAIEDHIRPYEIEMQKLLEPAFEYYYLQDEKEKKKGKTTKCPNCHSRKFVISIFGSICQDCFYEEK